MAQGDSPAVARRRVRLALREARTAMNLTQGDVAEVMEWSLSKVQRIEKGEVTIAPNDLRPLLAYLGFKDRQRVDDLVQAARVSRQRRQWWDQSKFRAHVTSSMLQLAGFEADAREIFLFFPMIVPGILQTSEYAEAIIRSHGDLDPEDATVRIEFREQRRREYFSSNSPAVLNVLLDESVLHRNLGNVAMYRAQLADLAETAKLGYVKIRIMPFAINENIPTLGPFEIYDLGGASDPDNEFNAVMYRESGLLDEVVDDRQKIEEHHKIFDRLWTISWDEAYSVDLVQRHAGGGEPR